LIIRTTRFKDANTAGLAAVKRRALAVVCAFADAASTVAKLVVQAIS